MIRLRAILGATMALLACAGIAGADPAKTRHIHIEDALILDTEEASCEVLKAAVVKQWHLPADTPKKWQWYCEADTIKHDYMRIMALRAGKCEAYSCLLGWFAVMRQSTVVLQFDVGNLRVVPLDDQ